MDLEEGLCAANEGIMLIPIQEHHQFWENLESAAMIYHRINQYVLALKTLGWVDIFCGSYHIQQTCSGKQIL